MRRPSAFLSSLTGLDLNWANYPPLKRWAIVECPYRDKEACWLRESASLTARVVHALIHSMVLLRLVTFPFRFGDLACTHS